VIYEAKLMEELPSDDPSEIRTPAFHGQSSSGNVTAQFVYANFGRGQDYDDLEQNHVDVKGIIAIVKYGIVYRGEKMSTAAKRGLVGILIYSDPQQDGNITEVHGYKAYPDGPARPETCIERGAIGSVRESCYCMSSVRTAAPLPSSSVRPANHLSSVSWTSTSPSRRTRYTGH
jgi:N-acetylated-alpha-linked acidic dipeptidase